MSIQTVTHIFKNKLGHTIEIEVGENMNTAELEAIEQAYDDVQPVTPDQILPETASIAAALAADDLSDAPDPAPADTSTDTPTLNEA